VIEHQLRPLFGFLNALTLPTSIYAVEADFKNYSVSNPRIDERIERVADEALRHLSLAAVTHPNRSTAESAAFA
jgi:FMN reductase